MQVHATFHAPQATIFTSHTLNPAIHAPPVPVSNSNSSVSIQLR
jgi:hypothetical protein